MQQWNRRQILAGFAFAMHLVAEKHSPMPHDIIDAHVHVWTPDEVRFPRDPHYSGPPAIPSSFTPERLLEIARPLGVKRVVLIQMSFYGTDNAYMLNAMKRHPGVFSGVAVVDHDSASVDGEMTRLASLGVRGFRIHRGNRPSGWLEADNMRHMWHLAAQKQLAICPLIDPSSFPALDRMCAEFPRTTVVIDHMARIGVDGVVREQDVKALCALAHHPRVYVKISAFYALGKKQYPYTDLVPMIHALYDAYGPERLMWGSDSPFQVETPHSYAGSLELVRDHLKFLRPEDSAWILRGTAEKIFFQAKE
jgi:predicted TIM-barrel fold metal-dependent hydrolase